MSLMIVYQFQAVNLELLLLKGRCALIRIINHSKAHVLVARTLLIPINGHSVAKLTKRYLEQIVRLIIVPHY